MKKQRSRSSGTSCAPNYGFKAILKSVSDTDFYSQPAFLNRVKRKPSIATITPTAKG